MSDGLQDDFKRAMRRLAATVNIVTCVDEAGGWHGMAATAVTSVCAEPAALLICVNRKASMSAHLLGSGHFCVNILGAGHRDLSDAFGGKRKGADRFAIGDWRSEARGLPFLADAQANLFCRVSNLLAHGTHSIIIGEVEAIRIAGTIAPLVYQDGGYGLVRQLDDIMT